MSEYFTMENGVKQGAWGTLNYFPYIFLALRIAFDVGRITVSIQEY